MQPLINPPLTLAQIAFILAALLALSSIPALLAPARFRAAVMAFPRSLWPGWILSAVCLAWVAWVILHASLGRFDFLKPYVYAAAPIAFFLVIKFMDELLAPRALGGLLMLLANPVLNVARWHDSAWRLLLVVIAYVWVVVGIVLMLSPYRFRQVAERLTRTNGIIRGLALIRLTIALLLLGLGVTIY